MTARIAIDIDSTIHHYWDTLSDVCRDEFGLELPTAERFVRGDTVLSAQQIEHAVAVSQSDRYVLAAKPYAGAVETICRWHESGSFIHITTHRPGQAEAATARWLAQIGLVYDDLYCSSDKVTRCVELGIELLIDDQPDNLERAVAEGLTAATIRHPWNDEVCQRLPIIAAASWAELEHKLAVML